MYNLLVQYKNQYKNIEVKKDYVTSNGENLGSWVRTQRTLYKRNELSQDREEKLRQLGFRFDKINKTIEELCLLYNIDYEKNKSILNKLIYDDFVSRLYYLLDNYMDVVDDNGYLNIIFIMDDITLYRFTDSTSEELKEYYNKKLELEKNNKTMATY